MKNLWLLILVFSFSSLLGQSESQLALEEQLDAQLDKSNIQAWIKKMSEKVHYVGTPFGRENAEFMVEQFKSWGYDAQIETFYVYFPKPKIRHLSIVGDDSYQPTLDEKPIPEDPSTLQSDLLPAYNAFSADGDVTAEVVFVNYGIPADYEELKRRGIDVKGKIVIAKYGGSWRGIKPKVAAEHGAIGCLIYSDPKDDGYGRGDVYPEGPFKNETGVQRGSVLDMPLYPGDPLTPFYGATKDAERLDPSEAPTLMKIPVLPISYGDALPILKALRGPVAPNQWTGGLPITYHLGPGPIQIRLQLAFDWQITPAHNVIAKLKGSTYPDEWVIRGNHHDAWVHGASDPVSGMAALMEEARVVGQLAQQGQPPLRTIIYCGWDAEEPGLLGSTEWAEYHAEELKEKAVAYINSDGNGRGFLRAGGSHTLEHFFDQVARSVEDPQTGVSVWERSQARSISLTGKAPSALKLSALGSGSDYTPFIQHLGIASLNIGFGGENAGGEYHTTYDTYRHYSLYKDPNFDYGLALAKVGGRTTLRLANAVILPFEFSRFYQTVNGYTQDLIRMTDQMRTDHAQHNQALADGSFELAKDPLASLSLPEPLPEVPYLNFSPLKNALVALEKAALNYQKAPKKESNQPLNELLASLEQQLTREHGLPGRPWFRHHIYAPGFYTGYGVKTLPGVREAIEQYDWNLATHQISILAEVLQDFSAAINEAASMTK
jgi:N-acetylated-alpha-linked acidic dipeptidase